MTKSSDFPETDFACRLRALAAEKPLNHPLPDPHLLWLKAQLEERAERQERALRPIVIAERVALVVIGVLGGLGLMAVVEWFEAWSEQSPAPDGLAWMVAGVCLLAVGFTFVLKPLTRD